MPLSGSRAALARSFGSVAGEYERARPGYPRAAVEWLAGERSVRVADLGAGTGKLTRTLVELGHDVVAIEPLAEMRELLRATLPDVEALDGTAEAIPLPDASVDVVTAGQAYHWFDASVAVPEIARVLRPGGTLGLIWNLRDDHEPWVAALSDLLGAETLTEELPHPPFFGEPAVRTFSFSQQLDAEGLVELIRSRSRCATLPADKQEELVGAVRRLALEHPALAGRETFELPYLTEASRFPRL